MKVSASGIFVELCLPFSARAAPCEHWTASEDSCIPRPPIFRLEKRWQQTVDLQQPGPRQVDFARADGEEAFLLQMAETVAVVAEDVRAELALEVIGLQAPGLQ